MPIAVLRHLAYRRLFTAQVVALVGTGLLTVALGLLAYGIAGSDAGAVLGTALAIKMVAYVAVAPVITALTHRVARKTLLMSADAIRAAIALLLPFVDQTWQIYVLIFLLQAASATFTPTFQSVLPAILTDDADYTRGLSLSRLAYDLEALVSPALAAVLLTVISYHLLFLGTAAGFLASAVLVLGSRLPRLTPTAATTTVRERITGGVAIMSASPVLRSLLAMNLVVAAATGLVVVDTVVYVHGLLGGASTDVAAALACYGAGSMAVALALPRVLNTVTDRTVMLTGCVVVPAGLVATTALLGAGPSPAIGWPLLAVSWAVLGAGCSLITTPSARLLRAESNSATSSSVFTAQFATSHACFLLTYPIAGWVGATLGQVTAAATLTVLATMAAVAAARAWPSRAPQNRELVSTGRG
jgi:Major Facilitator Superfamily